ncbi:hypothetical protein EJ05DRAFT_502825 [Pseudovirgaria hyperparasitica]|uniref:Uncharacterized protein n=1 Tax=Pseudovirgaria hyperparasitica TaxID=470096 RepID=A0A6A6W199_9PEZI|nr:uncharacterized protein EJ05DRAFT_502825 [Pseudovirgaria hyperparasitica]KAF2755357.1 hypothetical protein EJ05DRAFT_502825 [Pseudovirgaria hyperparasitica]
MDAPKTKQTLKQAKAAYKAHGPRISSHEARLAERNAELEARAQRIREAERRRRVLGRQRAEKERRERELREREGVGLATQLVGFSHSQRAMKSGMEGWVRRGGGGGGGDGGDDGCKRESGSGSGSGSKSEGEKKGRGEEEEEEEDEIFVGIVTGDTADGKERGVGSHSGAEAEAQAQRKDGDQDEDDDIFAEIETEGAHSTARQKGKSCPVAKDPWSEDDLDEESLLSIAVTPRHKPQSSMIAPPTEPLDQVRPPGSDLGSEEQREKCIPVIQPALDHITAKNANGKRPRAPAPVRSPSPREPSKDLPPRMSDAPKPIEIKTHKDHPNKIISETTRAIADNPVRKTMLDRAIRKPKPPPNKTDWKPPNASTGGVPFIKASVYQKIPQRDEWDDFLDSSTQIARELSGPKQAAKPAEIPLDVFICTQDLNLSLNDLEELGVPHAPSFSREDALFKAKTVSAPAPPAEKTVVSTGDGTARLGLQKAQLPARNVKPPVSNPNMLPPPRPPPKTVVEAPRIQAVPVMQAGRCPALKDDFGFSTQDMRSFVDDDITLSPD